MLIVFDAPELVYRGATHDWFEAVLGEPGIACEWIQEGNDFIRRALGCPTGGPHFVTIIDP